MIPMGVVVGSSGIGGGSSSSSSGTCSTVICKACSPNIWSLTASIRAISLRICILIIRLCLRKCIPLPRLGKNKISVPPWISTLSNKHHPHYPKFEIQYMYCKCPMRLFSNLREKGSYLRRGGVWVLIFPPKSWPDCNNFLKKQSNENISLISLSLIYK